MLAERYFEQMKKSGLKPTEGVYTELLRAYAMYVPTSTSLLLELDSQRVGHLFPVGIDLARPGRYRSSVPLTVDPVLWLATHRAQSAGAYMGHMPPTKMLKKQDWGPLHPMSLPPGGEYDLQSWREAVAESRPRLIPESKRKQRWRKKKEAERARRLGAGEAVSDGEDEEYDEEGEDEDGEDEGEGDKDEEGALLDVEGEQEIEEINEREARELELFALQEGPDSLNELAWLDAPFKLLDVLPDAEKERCGDTPHMHVLSSQTLR